MKRYCLKPKAKTQTIEALKSVGIAIYCLLFAAGFFSIVIAFILLVDSIIRLPVSLFVAPDSTTEFIISYIGILSWTAIFSLIIIGIKRWLQSNIIEC